MLSRRAGQCERAHGEVVREPGRAAEPWAGRTDGQVFTTTTGPLSREQLMCVELAVPHAGARRPDGDRAVRDEELGARRGHRPRGPGLSFDPVAGVAPSVPAPAGAAASVATADVHARPAVLLVGSPIEPASRCSRGTNRRLARRGRDHRTVQQQLTTPANLLEWTRTARAHCGGPPRSLASLLADVSGGSQSLAEIDVLQAVPRVGAGAAGRQKRRRDRPGALRFTDCEWDLPDGRVLVLEIDGAFHLDVENYTEDVQRHRRPDDRPAHRRPVHVLEVRHEPVGLMRDLGVGSPRAACPELGAQAVAEQPFRTQLRTHSWVLRWLPGQPFRHPTRIGGGQRRRSSRTGKAVR